MSEPVVFPQPQRVATPLEVTATLIAVAVVLGLFLIFAGRHVLLFFLLPALLPFITKNSISPTLPTVKKRQCS